MSKPHAKQKSTLVNAKRVKELLKANYEQGRYDKCKLAVFRTKIAPEIGISERTFWRYLNEADEKPAADPNQLKLWDAP